MASNSVDVSTGLTVTFGTSGFSAQIVAIKPPGASVGWVDTTHMGTTVARTCLPKDLIEWGEIEMLCHLNPDTDPGTTFAGTGGTKTETITIAYFGPDDAAGATWAGTGFMTEYDPQEAEVDDKMTVRVKAKITGDITVTADT